MVDDASIKLMKQWQAGDQQAAEQLFHRYAQQLVVLARSRLSPKLSRRLDPEDVVQSAYRSFFAGARDSHYQLKQGGDLWRLLVAITLHKLKDQVKHHTAEKRAVAAEQNFASEDSLLGIQPHSLTKEPSPVEAVVLADEVEKLMRKLDPVARRMLELRLQGHNLYEIAADTNLTQRTVRRVMGRIKQELIQEQAKLPRW